MSDNIETNGTQASFVTSSREGWWHLLGTNLGETFDADTALDLGGLRWLVEKHPLTQTIIEEDGVETIEVPGKFTTSRRNPVTGKRDILGVVGSRYTPVQNWENTALLNEIVGQSGAHFETAGSLDGGRLVFVSMKAPKGMMIGGRDAVDLYLVASNGHDGNSPFRLDATAIRPVCKNTLRAGWGSAVRTFKARHVGSVTGRVSEAEEALGIMWNYAAEFETMANHLIDTPMSDAEFKAFMEAHLFPVKEGEAKATVTRRENKTAEVWNLWKNADTQDNIRNTRWGAYNAVTEWWDWMAPINSDDPAARAARVAADPWLDVQKDKALAALL